ncbi:MAG: hypothetical protein CMO74_02830 [Verrucomicrobiales bacterium]|nr:hypothetical protein [Verrucomicrobiales bacterium]|tara:strand:+ start:1262 stop:2038 length:777 start_codon:yes stop_codon:yes gene_type:complete
MDLKGKAALVTGGSRGVGAATARMLAGAGCDVAVNYNASAEAAGQVVDDCQEAGARAISIQGDVASDVVCRHLVAESVNVFGRLDVLVNNAGTTRFVGFGNLDDVREEDWDRILAVNLKGPFQCARAARPHLATEGGVIVNTASVAGIRGAGSSIPYAASKAALINLTLALARSLGPEIRVNAVAPGFIEGDWLQEGLGENYEAIRQAKMKESLLDAVSTPEDIAQGILSLAMADKVTGHTLVIDGGHSVGPPLGGGI